MWDEEVTVARCKNGVGAALSGVCSISWGAVAGAHARSGCWQLVHMHAMMLWQQVWQVAVVERDGDGCVQVEPLPAGVVGPVGAAVLVVLVAGGAAALVVARCVVAVAGAGLAALD